MQIISYCTVPPSEQLRGRPTVASKGARSLATYTYECNKQHLLFGFSRPGSLLRRRFSVCGSRPATQPCACFFDPFFPLGLLPISACWVQTWLVSSFPGFADSELDGITDSASSRSRSLVSLAPLWEMYCMLFNCRGISFSLHFGCLQTDPEAHSHV